MAIILNQKKEIKEDKLVALLKMRNTSGFKYLYDNYAPSLYSYILEFVPNRESAADILHDVFINFFLKIDMYDPAKNRLYTWMMSVAKNRSLDFLKTKDYRNNSQNVDLSLAIIEYVKEGELVIDHIGMHKILFRLEDKYRIVLELNYYKGYTHAEIAEMLDLPIGTIKTRIRCALRLLRKIMSA